MLKKRSSRKPQNQKPSESIVERPLEELNLPTDILIEILKRLPLKSLVRSTCICKSWFSLLTSPTFLSTLATFNLRNSIDTQNFQLFREAINIHSEDCCTKFTVYSNSNFLLKKTEFECPVGKKHHVVSSADGLVCLFDFYSRNPGMEPLILWNPSIRKTLVAPVPVNGTVVEFTSGGFPKLIFGFGYDSSSNGYKVVQISYHNGGRGVSDGTSFQANVYCVSNCEWKNLGLSVVPQNIITIRWRGVYLNGVIHWVCNVNVNVDGKDRIHRTILTFKLGNEEFSELKLPKELVDVTNHTLKVVTVPRVGKEVLGVVHNVTNSFSLWVTEEYALKESWVKLFSINFGSMIRNDMNVVVLSDQVVVVKTLLGGWRSYDHSRKQIFYHHNTIPEGLDYVDSYVESLILLGQRKGVLPSKEVKQESPKPRRLRRFKRGNARAT
ncbi:F-box/kelch-repeat protein At3g23880 [Beta vulgaris subsp. vulgaris]|uniref:F-box/kelch-repeat protein At3g23880 n=1 Tax=Beta vulgaris subsp. vulgaris TaxID=3555 RepID=UPI00203710C6|nr:F-box/kelch-repeat protein At3g23880 [Beta vulgaris subsp. vulgaris]